MNKNCVRKRCNSEQVIGNFTPKYYSWAVAGKTNEFLYLPNLLPKNNVACIFKYPPIKFLLCSSKKLKGAGVFYSLVRLSWIKKGLGGKRKGRPFLQSFVKDQLSTYKTLSMGALLCLLFSNHLHLGFWFCSLLGKNSFEIEWRSSVLSKYSQDLTIYLDVQSNYLAAWVRHSGCRTPKFRCHYSGEGLNPELPCHCCHSTRLLQDILVPCGSSALAYLNIHQDKESKWVWYYNRVIRACKRWVLCPTHMSI